jgi:rfaE bifunctional protein kinase chain/domain
MTTPDLDRIFTALRKVRVAILGDFCLDHYLFIDPEWKETSIETGLPVHGVADQRYGPGGAGNVAANVAALSVGAVHCLGCIGDDPYGFCLQSCLGKLGCETSGMLLQPQQFSTRAYVKPMHGNEEGSRLDHGVANRISPETTRRLAAHLETLLPNLDAVILNQQVTAGVWSEPLIEAVNGLMARFPKVSWLVDSRHHAKAFKGALLKLNSSEAARLNDRDVHPGEPVTEAETCVDLDRLFERFSAPVVITRGECGAIARDRSGTFAVPGVQSLDEIDTVGAGDTFISALASCLGAQLGLETALKMANWSAAITVRKLRQTGTASEAEIRALVTDISYVHEPELAAHPRRARRLDALDAEVIRPRSLKGVRFVLFDHDGTLSTLREGWEQVMEPMMVRAILGTQHDHVDDRTFQRVVTRVQVYIERSTGLPTLRQMQELVGLVRQFGFVPESQVLDPHGYKAVYNEALMQIVNDRLDRIARGERAREDFIIKGSVEFLNALKAKGLTLALASGTDHADVVREAELLGYAGLFDGGIHGAVESIAHCSKRKVLEDVLARFKASGEAILVCGDGPVEIREARRRDAIAMGVASDEVRRFGWNNAKRSRLIRAGADYLVPDWSQQQGLVKALLG